MINTDLVLMSGFMNSGIFSVDNHTAVIDACKM